MWLALRRGLQAFWTGALYGIVPPLVEWGQRGVPTSLHALAGFVFLGGTSASIASTLGHWTGSAERGRRLGLLAPASLTTLLLLFYVNVVAMPEVGLRHPRSLAWDVVVVLCVWLPTLVLLWKARRPSAASGIPSLVLSTALVVTGLGVVVPLWPFDPQAPAGRGHGPDLLLVSLDAVRRDHLSLYGYTHPTSPVIDRLGAEARVFDSALAASSWTRYSVPAILGVQSGSRRVSLVESLRERGYTTASFSDNPLLEEGSRLSRGFDHVGVSYRPGLRFVQRVFEGSFVGDLVLRWPFLAYVWSDEALATRAMAWSRRVEGPLFLYVHMMDAHMPYKRPTLDGRAWRSRRLDSPLTGTKLSAGEVEDVVAHYDGGIHSADAQVGRLVDAMRQRGRPYLVIVTADHGENLGRGNRWGHGHDLGPDLLWVPLLVLGQGVMPGRVAQHVGHASIGPTLLRAAGDSCAGCEGADLRVGSGSAVVEGGLPPDLVYRVSEHYKVVLNVRTGERQLYDLSADPHEQDDLDSRQPELADRLAQGMSAKVEPQALSAEDLERMRALGYVDATVKAPDAKTPPKD